MDGLCVFQILVALGLWLLIGSIGGLIGIGLAELWDRLT